MERFIDIFDFLVADRNDIADHFRMDNGVGGKFGNFKLVERFDKRVARTDYTVVFDKYNGRVRRDGLRNLLGRGDVDTERQCL